MASKWAHLKGQYQEAHEDPGYAGRVRDEISRLSVYPDGHERAGEKRPIAEITTDLNAAEAEKDELEARISAINLRKRALELTILKIMEVEGCEAWRGNGSTYSEKINPYPSVKDKVALRQWCVENQSEDLLTVHTKTLESLCKDAILEGRELPSGVEVFIKSSVSRTKSGK